MFFLFLFLLLFILSFSLHYSVIAFILPLCYLLSCRCDRGLDQDMPGTTGDDDWYSPERLAHVNMSLIDTMVYRILLQMISIGGPLFDNPVCDNVRLGACDEFLYKKSATNKDHVKLAREIAAASAALLQNDKNVLPLNQLPKGAVIGLLGGSCAPYYNSSGMAVCSLNYLSYS
jgi:beta-glucosidase-like glycosyl hydrolase